MVPGLYLKGRRAHISVMTMRPYAPTIEMLRRAKLRPTRQRLALAQILFDPGHRHVTAEQLHAEAQKANILVSLATVYNALHQFTAAGLLRQVVVEAGRAYFDTNIGDHHHFFFEETGLLQDVPADAVVVTDLPPTPQGANLSRVDVIIRLRGRADG